MTHHDDEIILSPAAHRERVFIVVIVVTYILVGLALILPTAPQGVNLGPARKIEQAQIISAEPRFDQKGLYAGTFTEATFEVAGKIYNAKGLITDGLRLEPGKQPLIQVSYSPTDPTQAELIGASAGVAGKDTRTIKIILFALGFLVLFGLYYAWKHAGAVYQDEHLTDNTEKQPTH